MKIKFLVLLRETNAKWLMEKYKRKLPNMKSMIYAPVGVVSVEKVTQNHGPCSKEEIHLR